MFDQREVGTWLTLIASYIMITYLWSLNWFIMLPGFQCWNIPAQGTFTRRSCVLVVRALWHVGGTLPNEVRRNEINRACLLFASDVYRRHSLLILPLLPFILRYRSVYSKTSQPWLKSIDFCILYSTTRLVGDALCWIKVSELD